MASSYPRCFQSSILTKIEFKLPYPDALLKDAIDTKLLERASEFLRRREGISIFSDLYARNPELGLFNALLENDLQTLRVPLGYTTLVGQQYSANVGYFGHNIYFDPVEENSEKPSLMVQSGWIPDESNRDLVLYPGILVYKWLDLGGRFSVGTRTAFNPKNFNQDYTARHISMPIAHLDFSDPLLNNASHATVSFFRPQNGTSWFQLDCVDYDGKVIPMSSYSIVSNTPRVIRVFNKTFNITYGNIPNFYPDNEAFRVADNLVFLLGGLISGKKLIDVTDLPRAIP